MSPEYEYFLKFNWSSNPFTLTVLPELMVGYSQQSDSLLSHIHNSHKFALIVGPTGSGKTTLLLWVRSQLMAYKKFFPYYVSKPPRSPSNLILLMKSIFGFNLLDKFRHRNISLFDVQKFIFRKLRKRHLVLLIDEAHEFSITNLEWLRTLADSIPNVSVVLAGLPVFEKKLETQLPTLWMRITTKTYLNSLSKTEMESLIMKRIECAGGDGLNPFTSDAINKIFEITNGFPREVIKICDKLIREAAEKNISNINQTLVEECVGGFGPQPSLELKASLSEKQNQILRLLNENPNLTPSHIIEKLDLTEYKSKDNAIRSINNILKRLMLDDLIQRKKLANSYVYFLTGKAKTVFTEA
jgi:type II secretory pathway predicted ATPase ExeA